MEQPEIIACEELLRTAMLSSNVKRLDELMADDLIFVNQFGQIFSKEMDIEAHRSGNLKITGIEVWIKKLDCWII